jgi:hypothetical protein
VVAVRGAVVDALGAVDAPAEVVGVTTIRATRVSPASHGGSLRHGVKHGKALRALICRNIDLPKH